MNVLRDIGQLSRPRVVGTVSVGHGAHEFFSIVIPPVIPLVVADLGMTYAEAGLLLSAFFVMFSLFQLPAGMLADRLGKRRLLLLGLGGMSVGVFVASLAPDFPTLLVAQAIAGISGSTFHPAGMAMISDAETSATEGRAMGVFGAGGKAGTMAAPLLVGGLAAIGDWRVALAGAAVAGLLVTVLLAPLLGRGRSTTRPGWNRGASDGGRPSGLPLDLRAAAGRLQVPLSRQIAILCGIAFLISIQSRAIQTFTTAYVVEGTASSISVGNLAFFALLLGGGLAQPVAGNLADRFDRGLLGAVAAVLTAVLVGATVLLATLSGRLDPSALVVVTVGWLFLIGAAMYAISPVKNALVSANAGAGYSAGLFGVIQTASAVGSATGPALFGFLATERGLVAAYPVVALVSALIAVLFVALRWESRARG